MMPPRNLVDVVLDLGYVGDRPAPRRLARDVAMLLDDLPGLSEWRSVTVAAGAFPASLSQIQPNQWYRFDRIEWIAWKALVSKPGLVRTPDYGDYGIAHIAWPPDAPVTPSAQLRYTSGDQFLVRRAEKRDGNDAFYGICADLAGNAHEFYGEDFSVGDRAIAGKAKRMGGPGNPSIWREIGTNHHLAVVLEDLAKLSLP